MTKSPPPGYHENAQGHLVPDSLIADIELQRDDVVKELVAQCREASAALSAIKRTLADTVSSHISLVAEKYDIHIGGDKGNVTLTSYNGRLKIQRARANRITIGEAIVAAEAIINQLIEEWTSDARPELGQIINRAFRRNESGQLSVPRLIDLTKVEIDDPRWEQAVQAINDSLQQEDAITYFRAYQRDNTDQAWRPIPLDLAAVLPAAAPEAVP